MSVEPYIIPFFMGLSRSGRLVKRGYHRTYHHMSEKHLDRYVGEFARRHNISPLDTINMMARLAGGMDRNTAAVSGPHWLTTVIFQPVRV